MTSATHLITAILSLGLGTLSHATITMYAAWDLNEGSGTTTTQYQLGGGETWNQVTNPAAGLTATASENISSVGGSWGTAGPAPNSTSSLTFTASGGGADLETNVSGTGLSGSGAKTFVAWINPTGLDTSGSGIFSYSPTNGEGAGEDLRFVLDSNGDLRAEVSSGFFLYDITGSEGNGAGLVGDGWTFVAVIFDTDTDTSRFYIGGQGMVTPTSRSANQSITTAASTSNNGVSTITLGGAQESLPRRSFVGGIDMAAIYTGAASEAELDAIYANGIAVPEPGTLTLVGLTIVTLLMIRKRGERNRISNTSQSLFYKCIESSD